MLPNLRRRYDGDLICVSRSLRHVRGGSALRFIDMLWWTTMFGNVGSAWWGWSSRSTMVVFLHGSRDASSTAIVVLWQCRSLTKVVLWWIPLEYQWIISDKDVEVVNNESDVQGSEGRWWGKIVIVNESVQITSDKSGSSGFVGSLVARAVQADLLVVCQMFVP